MQPVEKTLVFMRRAARALRNRVGLAADYLRYRCAFAPYRQAISPAPPQGKVLFVAGRGMNIGWAQIWTYLSLSFLQQGLKPYVLTMKSQRLIRRYFALTGTKNVDMDALIDARARPFNDSVLRDDMSVSEWKALHYHNMPVGQMALSTYCRYHATGFIDQTRGEMRAFAREWIQGICRAYDAAAAFYAREGITAAVFTETFIEEYGGFYYAALKAGLDVIKTSGTVRDNAVVVQRRTPANERLHHAALTDAAWQHVLALPDMPSIRAGVEKNFSDRYGDKWLRSARNHKNTRIVSREEGRKELGITDDQKVVVAFSHILYDALFHYGDELYQDYATWLVETVRLAIRNPKVIWYIKLHPSNMWRGEFQSLLGGRYEEEKIIAEHIGELPAHVRLIYADTRISPFGWYQIADYGISVRGTAGLEMACLGKPVITAGTGRYEGKGFTIDPANIQQYEEILLCLPALPPLMEAQTDLAIRYAHGLFNLKPFTLAALAPTRAFGKKEIKASDDIAYIPAPLSQGAALPTEIARFAEYLADKRQLDLLSDA